MVELKYSFNELSRDVELDGHKEHQMSEVKVAFFSTLMSQYLHQNGLLWSRIQVLTAIQAAVIAGAFVVTKSSFAPYNDVLYIGVLCLGVVLTSLLLMVQ